MKQGITQVKSKMGIKAVRNLLSGFAADDESVAAAAATAV
jgi:hypothetical protein